MAKVGRKTVFSPKVASDIVASIKKGVFETHACVAAGISKATYYKFLARGRRSKSGKFREFSDAVEQAKAESVAHLVKTVEKAATTQWRAAAWLLERQHPAEFGRIDREQAERSSQPQASPTAAAPSIMDPSGLTTTELDTLKALLMKATRPAEPRPTLTAPTMPPEGSTH